LAGGNSAPSWPRPCPVKGEPLAASSWPPGSTTKLSICEVPVRADEVVAGGVEEHVAQAGVIWHGDRRAGDGGQAAIEMQAEAGVAAAWAPEFALRHRSVRFGVTGTLPPVRGRAG
jgi:hypothetical protein